MKSKDDQINKLRQSINELTTENIILRTKMNNIKDDAEGWQFLALQALKNYDHIKLINDICIETGIVLKGKRQLIKTIFKNTVN